MKINSISSVYFGKKPKVNKDVWRNDSKNFICPNNKENKIARAFKNSINCLCKSADLRDPSTKEFMKECEHFFQEKL